MNEQFNENKHDVNLLKTVVNLYMTLRPETKQSDIAKRLGVNQVMVSRVLSQDEYEVKPEWVPVINELLSEIDVDSYIEKINNLSALRKQYIEGKRIAKIASVITKYLEILMDEEFQYTESISAIRMNRIRIQSALGTEKWEFYDIDTFRKNNETSLDWLSLFGSIIPDVAGNCIVFTEDEDLFFDIVDYYRGIQGLRVNKQNTILRIPDAAMLINAEMECVSCYIHIK